MTTLLDAADTITQTNFLCNSFLLFIGQVAMASKDFPFEVGHVLVPELGSFTVERARAEMETSVRASRPSSAEAVLRYIRLTYLALLRDSASSKGLLERS